MNAEARTDADLGTTGSASEDRHWPKVGGPTAVEVALALRGIVLIDMRPSFMDAPASHFRRCIAWALAHACRPYGLVLEPFMDVLVYE